MGGALTDLVSRISILERDSIKCPSYKTVAQQWTFGMNGANGDIIPGWKQGDYPSYSPVYTVNQSGMLLFLCAANAITQTPDNRVGFGWQVNGREIGSVNAVGERTYDSNETNSTLFVKAGDSFRFSARNTANTGIKDPNASSNYARVYLLV